MGTATFLRNTSARMTIPDIRGTVGAFPRFLRYAILLFAWYLLRALLDWQQELQPESHLIPSITALLRLFATPFLLAGILAGVHQRLRGEPSRGVERFLTNALSFYLPILGAMMLLLIAAALVLLVASTAVPAIQNPGSGQAPFLVIPMSALTVFWLAGITVERGKIWRSLARSVRLLFTTAAAPVVGLTWAVVSWIIGEDVLMQSQLWHLCIEPALRAVTMILAYSCAITLYRRAKVEIFGELEEDSAAPASPAALSVNRVSRRCLLLTFLSVVPVLSIVSFVAGVFTLKRAREGRVPALAAACFGAFFTILYAVTLSGYLLAKDASTDAPGYAFLADADARLQPAVALMKAADYLGADRELNALLGSEPQPDWPLLTAVAVVQQQLGDMAAALEHLEKAEEQEPGSAEFSYHHAQLLLSNGSDVAATEKLTRALEIDPDLEPARRLQALIDSRVELEKPVSYVGMAIILLFLLTCHEYGHAYSAWRLGDDTARNAGRLTLNPIAHLDLVGSIILPGILLASNSEFLFGWAKPVPVDKSKLKNPRGDDMIVSFAGPGMNLLIGLLSFLVLALLALVLRMTWPGVESSNFGIPFTATSITGTPWNREFAIAVILLKQMFFVSLLLAFLNLIPVPPLDGSWILSGLLPENARQWFEKLRPYSLLLLLAIFLTPAVEVLLFIPLGVTVGVMQLCFLAMGFG